MYNDDVKQHIKNMEEMFGVLPNPSHMPIAFQHFVRLYQFYENRKKKD